MIDVRLHLPACVQKKDGRVLVLSGFGDEMMVVGLVQVYYAIAV